MRFTLTILILLLLSIFILSTRNFIKSSSQFSETTVQPIQEFNFDPSLETHPGFKELEARITEIIIECRNSMNSYTTWLIILNFIVTLITGISALVTSISAIKQANPTKSAAIAAAIIMFVSSLLSFEVGQLNSSKTQAEEKKKKVIEIRDQLESLKPSEVDAQIPLFKRQLDEEF